MLNQEVTFPLNPGEREDGEVRYRLVATRSYAIDGDPATPAFVLVAMRRQSLLELVELVAAHLEAGPSFFRHVEVEAATTMDRCFVWGFYQIDRALALGSDPCCIDPRGGYHNLDCEHCGGGD